jgi:hypothetical protein
MGMTETADRFLGFFELTNQLHPWLLPAVLMPTVILAHLIGLKEHPRVGNRKQPYTEPDPRRVTTRRIRTPSSTPHCRFVATW